MARLPDALAGPLLRLSATPVGARVARTVLPPADLLLSRLSGGRTTVAELLLPVVVVTTTGHRTGRSRQQPLTGIPVGDGWAVAGTNWGQPQHPAWTENLLADPHASVTVDGTTTTVVARLLDGRERVDVWQRFLAIAPNYRRYEQRIEGRDVRVFVLEPSG